MNFSNYPFYEMLEKQTQKKIDSWAIRFYTSFFLENNYFLFPNKSLVENIGFNDENATHTKTKSHFELVDYSNEKIIITKQTVILNKKIIKLINLVEKKNKKKSNLTRLKLKIKKVLK